MMRSMDDFVWEGEDNFFEATHHMAMVLDEESNCAFGDCFDSVEEGRLPGDVLRLSVDGVDPDAQEDPRAA